MTKTATRIPLNTFAISLGLTGLAEVWTCACAALNIPSVVAECLWIVAAIGWLLMIAAHIARGARSEASFASQLRHPAQGSIAAILPIVGMLLGINLHGFWALGGTILVVASIVVSTVFAGWILAFWMRGELALESVHGGYLLPTVAASFVAGGAASVIGARMLATGAFAVGVLFWALMFALVAGRLAFRAPLPGPLVPTIAILMAPPAVAGVSWFDFNGGRIDAVEEGLLGIAIILVLMQLTFLPRYLRLGFSLGFWSFTFPAGSMGAFLILWISRAPFAGWQVIAYALLALVTVLVLTIAFFSIRLFIRDRAAAADAQLTAADASIERSVGDPNAAA